ncbi:DUF6591 domain-containing protein [Dysgonomonas capnocytophagoides]|nr:DUF6591 domain-containing protein [Dysgonomonas capnocytophagoides]
MFTKKLSTGICLSLFLLMSCSDSKTIKVENAQIIDGNNNITGFIKVIENSYNIKSITIGTSEGSEIGVETTIEFKVLKDCSMYAFEEQSTYLLPKDKNGNVIRDDQNDSVKMTPQYLDDYNLINSSIGNRPKVTFIYMSPNNETQKNILENISSFEILVKTKKKEIPKELSPDSNKTSSSEWDKVLDSYEKYIDQYAKLYKKAQAGDMSAMTEYASMLEKANDLSSKLNGAKSDMSAAQIARFTKLQAKLISAVQ